MFKNGRFLENFKGLKTWKNMQVRSISIIGIHRKPDFYKAKAELRKMASFPIVYKIGIFGEEAIDIAKIS